MAQKLDVILEQYLRTIVDLSGRLAHLAIEKDEILAKLIAAENKIKELTSPPETPQ